jgi:predicted ATPase
MQWLCIDARTEAMLAELNKLALTYQEQFDFQPANRALEVMCRGKNLVASGHVTEGIELIYASIEMAALNQYELMYKSHFQAILAQAQIAAGDFVQALAAVDAALAHTATYDDNYYLAELHRLKGEALLAAGESHEAVEQCFIKSLDIACHQQAKSLELRTVTSLARLWMQQGKQGEAHALLAEIYGWFTEGFDTPDLQEARALLAKLA